MMYQSVEGKNQTTKQDKICVWKYIPQKCLEEYVGEFSVFQKSGFLKNIFDNTINQFYKLQLYSKNSRFPAEAILCQFDQKA